MKTYVDWAVKHGFAVLDVNLPEHVTDADDSQEHEHANSVESRTREATLLLAYLWDNYIELNESTHVFLMGTNTGHGAIINLIKANEERAQAQMTTAISFVEDVPLQSCKSATNDALAPWYFANSLIFVTPEHNFWFSDLARKPKKRFGHVERSTEESISDMLIVHKQQVFETLLQETAGWRAENSQNVVNDAMEVSGSGSITSPQRLPPVSNFAPSSALKSVAMTNLTSLPPSNSVSSPQGGAPSPHTGSSPKAPPLGNFALSSRQQRASRSPTR